MKRTHWLNAVLRALFGLELRRAVHHRARDFSIPTVATRYHASKTE